MAETASSTLLPDTQELEDFAQDSLRHPLQVVTAPRTEHHGKIHQLLPVLCLIVA